MSHHVHDMLPDSETNVFKCSSCAFRCTDKVLAEVEKNPQAHRAIKSTEKQAKEVYGR